MDGKKSVSIKGIGIIFIFIILFGQSVMAETLTLYQLALAVNYAQLSAAVYDAGTSKEMNVEGWKRIKGMGQIGESGFKATVYISEARKEIVIAFAGTQDAKDWVTDIAALMATPAQYKEAKDFTSKTVKKIAEKYGNDYKITVTGHSLGGGLAQSVAANYGLDAYTFNAAAPSKSVVNSLDQVKVKKIINIVGSQDPVNKVTLTLGGTNLGKTFDIETNVKSSAFDKVPDWPFGAWSNFKDDLSEMHSIKTLVNALEEGSNHYEENYRSAANVASISQALNTISVGDNSTINPNGRPTKHLGAIVAMLTQTPAGGYYGKMYFTGYEAANLYSSSIRAESSEGYVLKLDGSSGRFKVTSLETPTGDVTSGLPVNVEKHELGHNSALEWGYWLQENHMRAGGADYYFENSYYIQGDNTPDKQMQALRTLNVTGTYKGSAYATYGEAPGGASIGQNMSGSFSADVNFSSRTLNNINISVSGNGHSATVRGTTAFFSGGSSTFTGNGDGSWKIDGVTAGASLTAERGLGGSFYGPNAKAIGGLFGMSTPANKYVTGAFQGTR